MRPAWLLLAAVPLLAQPVVDAANPEGIVLAPNGKIRHVWNRKGIWRTCPSHPTLNALSALFQATPTGTALPAFWVKESRPISPTRFSTGETESVYFDFNRLPCRLAALTPAEAAIPACYLPAADKDGRYVAQGEFLPDTGNPQCQPLVTDNLSYFDKPRSVPQLLWVNAFGRCAKLDNGRLLARSQYRSPLPPQGCQIHLRFWAELDWNRIAALLVP